MDRRIAFYFLFISSLHVFAQNKQTKEVYIDSYKNIAIREMKRSGVPASITLAQGMLESEYGNSTLAKKANNHFGIKCHNDWNGKTYFHDDDRPNECFRKYDSPEESFRDHTEFLITHQRYDFLFEFETTDYKNWAKGLRKAGYATNKEYDKLLIRIIENNQLYLFDSKKYRSIDQPGNKTKQPSNLLAEDSDNLTIDPFGNDVKTNNRIDYVIVKSGDTFESIAQRHDIRSWQIYKYNELPKDAQIIPGTKIYLQPKRRKADIRHKTHTIEPGENMYIISQEFGIRLKSLYRINRMEFGSEPEIGYTLSLRKRVPEKN